MSQPGKALCPRHALTKTKNFLLTDTRGYPFGLTCNWLNRDRSLIAIYILGLV